MSTDYTSFLAARLFSDSKLITYRLLSRELNVHVAKAKEYLATFHESENKKKQGSCHATYIVTGIPKPPPTIEPKTDEDHDTVMESSPPDPTQQDVEVVKTTSVVLVAEEDLEEIKESMQEVISVHVYSIEPGPLSDLLLIADASTELYSRFSALEPIEKSKRYGTTLNKHIKKREGAPPPPPPPQSMKSSAYVVPVKKEPLTQASTPSSSIPKDQKKDGKKDFFGSLKKKDEAPKSSQTSEVSSSASKAKVPLKRGQSDLMSSFSNTQPKKPKQPVKEETPPPDFMDVDDEPEVEEPEDPEAKAAEDAKQKALKKKRDDEEEELRRMMDEDDDEPEPSIDKPTAGSPPASTSPEATGGSPATEEPASAPSAAAPGRRKVKRKVTKKIRSKDENGYIVTKEVTEWEEFSEDDVPAPAKPAAKPNAFSAMKQSSGSQKSKKPGGDTGGKKKDITSFFGKR